MNNDIETVVQMLDEVRAGLLKADFEIPQIAYNRKRLEKAKDLRPAIKYLNALKEAIRNFENSPLFPGIKRIEDYAIVGLKNTKEQKIYADRRAIVRAIWQNRPDVLRKRSK